MYFCNVLPIHFLRVTLNNNIFDHRSHMVSQLIQMTGAFTYVR